MKYTRQKKVVTLTLDPDLWEELGAWIAKQEIRHPKNAVVEVALRRFLDSGSAVVQINCSGSDGS